MPADLKVEKLLVVIYKSPEGIGRENHAFIRNLFFLES
jgi:hypothetical protein